MFEIRVKKSLIKEVEKLSKSHKRKLAKFIESLKYNPIPTPAFDVKRVESKKRRDIKRFRLRLGDYRLFYDVYWRENCSSFKVGKKRKSVFKKIAIFLRFLQHSNSF